MANHFVPEQLLREIDDKKRCIEEQSSDSSLDLVTVERNYLWVMATQHSARIETPKSTFYKKDLKESLRTATKATLRKYSANLCAAWDFGKRNLTLPMTPEFIKMLALRADPDFFATNYAASEDLKRGMAPYRAVTEAVTPSGSKHTSTYPAKIPLEMNLFEEQARVLYEAVEEGTMHPVELAAFCHFHLARIHPFGDANGRTARMLQNLILSKKGFTPAIIREGERTHYHSMLENAVDGYLLRNREDFLEPSSEEKQFYLFVASKLNLGLDCILDRVGSH